MTKYAASNNFKNSYDRIELWKSEDGGSYLSKREVMPMSNSSKSGRKEEQLLTAFEVVQTIIGFGSFTIALIGLCYKIFKDDGKK